MLALRWPVALLLVWTFAIVGVHAGLLSRNPLVTYVIWAIGIICIACFAAVIQGQTGRSSTAAFVARFAIMILGALGSLYVSKTILEPAWNDQFVRAWAEEASQALFGTSADRQLRNSKETISDLYLELFSHVLYESEHIDIRLKSLSSFWGGAVAQRGPGELSIEILFPVPDEQTTRTVAAWHSDDSPSWGNKISLRAAHDHPEAREEVWMNGQVVWPEGFENLTLAYLTLHMPLTFAETYTIPQRGTYFRNRTAIEASESALTLLVPRGMEQRVRGVVGDAEPLIHLVRLGFTAPFFGTIGACFFLMMTWRDWE